jgi:hypothetical protein
MSVEVGKVIGKEGICVDDVEVLDDASSDPARAAVGSIGNKTVEFDLSGSPA